MGQSAKNQHILNYKNTIYGFRDLLGRKFSDPYVQQEMKNLPFSIIPQKNDSIGIKVGYRISPLDLFPLWVAVGVGERGGLQDHS